MSLSLYNKAIVNWNVQFVLIYSVCTSQFAINDKYFQKVVIVVYQRGALDFVALAEPSPFLPGQFIQPLIIDTLKLSAISTIAVQLAACFCLFLIHSGLKTLEFGLALAFHWQNLSQAVVSAKHTNKVTYT